MFHAFPIFRKNRTTGYLYMRLAQKLHFLRHQSFINNSHRPGDQRSRTADIPDQRALFQIGLEGKADETGRFRIPHGKVFGHDNGIRVIPAEQEIPDHDFSVPEDRRLQIHAYTHAAFRIVA